MPLHRREIIHRDIKPDNVILAADGVLKLIDLGVARLPRVEDFAANEIPGTAGFLAPEQYHGSPGDSLSDQFALGGTLYRWFTGQWPFGEQEPFSRPRFGTPLPLSRFRPDIPAWLDSVILRAIAVEPADRHGDVLELVSQLEAGGAMDRPPERRFVPWFERDPLRAWQAIALLLAMALIVSLVSG